MLKRKGQSTLEYVIVLTAIVAAVLLATTQFLGKKESGAGVGKLMYQSGERIKTESGKIAAIVP